jgi:hypothetical protein
VYVRKKFFTFNLTGFCPENFFECPELFECPPTFLGKILTKNFFAAGHHRFRRAILADPPPQSKGASFATEIWL